MHNKRASSEKYKMPLEEKRVFFCCHKVNFNCFRGRIAKFLEGYSVYVISCESSLLSPRLLERAPRRPRLRAEEETAGEPQKQTGGPAISSSRRRPQQSQPRSVLPLHNDLSVDVHT